MSDAQFPPPGGTPDPAPAGPPTPPPPVASSSGPAAPGSWPPPQYAPSHPSYPSTAGYSGVPLNKPGTVPLRPLGLGDVLDGAFSTMRRNPKATIGLGILVTLAFMALPILLTVLVQAAGGSVDLINKGNDPAPDISQYLPFFGIIAAMSVASAAATIVVSGLTVPVVTRASLGEKISSGDAWRRARGRLLALVGLSLLELLLVLGLAGVVTLLVIVVGGVAGILLGILIGLLGTIGIVYLYVRYFILGAVVIVSERQPILAALRRGGRLTRGQWWRIFGIYLLCSIIAGFVGQILATPIAVVATVAMALAPESIGSFLYLLSLNLGRVVEGAIVAPFSGAVAVLLYLDQRFRKEAFDVDLIQHVQQRRESAGPTA